MNAGNGSGLPNVPPDIEWNEDDPPVVFNCSNHIEHDARCNGECGWFIPNESQVDLMNEARAWARVGMNFFGIPTAYAGTIPVNGIHVELFDLECKFQVLREMVIELAGIDEEELEERFRKFKLTAMRNIREQNEAAVRSQRAAEMLRIAKKPLLGPDGNPLM